MLSRSNRRKSLTGIEQRRSMMRYARLLVALTLVFTMGLVGVLRTAEAADGDLDPTFDTDGRQTTDFPGQPEQGRAIAIQEDGKVVVAGYAAQPPPPPVTAGANSDFAVARYNTDGSPDNTFSSDGMVTIDISGNNNEANAVAIQDDGKIVVGGFVSGKGTAFALARLNTDGSLDDGTVNDSTPGDEFGIDGIVITDDFPEGINGVIHDLAIQDDGKIVAAGSVEFFFIGDRPQNGRVVGGDVDRDFALARYNEDGSLDQPFGDGGHVQTNFFKGNDDQAFGVALQDDGKIVAAGSTLAPPTPPGATSGITGEDFALARYNTDGSLDDGESGDTTPTDEFGDSGRVITDFEGLDDEAQDVKIQEDGKIVAGGWAVIVGDAIEAGGDRDFAAARYNPDGTLDAAPPLSSGNGHFSDDGLVTTDINNQRNEAYGLAIQDDGKIVLAGFVVVPIGAVGQSPEGEADHDFALVRYNTDGSLDDGTASDSTPGGDFGDAGIVTTDFFGDVDQARDVAIQEDGKIVAAGYAFNQPTLGGPGFGFLFAAARYEAGESADLAVEVTDTPDPVVAGKNVTYTIKVTNNGPSTATNVVLRNRIPSSSIFISATTNQGTCSNNDEPPVTCQLGTMTSGDMAIVKVKVQSLSVHNMIFNTSTVSADQPDPDMTNNEEIEKTTVLRLRKLSFSPAALTGGCQNSTGTILLTNPAPAGGLKFQLSDDSAAVQVPMMVTVPGDALSATFPVTTHMVDMETVVTVTAKDGTNMISGKMRLFPVRMMTFTITPGTVEGGQSATGKVTLKCAPEHDVVVKVTSNKGAAKPAQSQIVIPAGQTMGQFTINTQHVPNQRDVTFTAVANGEGKQAVLHVVP